MKTSKIYAEKMTADCLISEMVTSAAIKLWKVRREVEVAKISQPIEHIAVKNTAARLNSVRKTVKIKTDKILRR
jgi:hypothetical protein